MKTILLAASAAVLLASPAMAGIVGSTHDFSTSTTGTTTITSSGAGSYTDPANASFCVGPNSDDCASSGLAGTYVFSDLNASLSQITFQFSGGTDQANGSFSILLSNFADPGSTITGVAFSSGNIDPSDDFGFGVTWDGTTATFTGTPSSFNDYFAVGGRSATFDVTLAPIPEPSTYALLAAGLVSILALRRRLQGPLGQNPRAVSGKP